MPISVDMETNRTHWICHIDPPIPQGAGTLKTLTLILKLACYLSALVIELQAASCFQMYFLKMKAKLMHLYTSYTQTTEDNVLNVSECPNLICLMWKFGD